MLIAIIGENCVGKTTLANRLNETLHAKIYAGKDFLRLEKSPSAAEDAFRALLTGAVSGENLIWLITEKEHLKLLPEGTIRIVLTGELDTIKERFRVRMRGNLPLPLEKMLEAKHGMYDNLPCHLRLDGNYDVEAVLRSLPRNP